MICERCGRQFEATNPARFCGVRCRVAAWRAARLGRVTVTAERGQAEALSLLAALETGVTPVDTLLAFVRATQPAVSHRVLLALETGHVAEATRLLRTLTKRG